MLDGQRLVFLDVDGTIIDHDGSIPPSASAAIREARANGHLVMVNTGRGPQELDPRLCHIGFDGLVCAAGAFATVDGDLIVNRVMRPENVRRMVHVFQSGGVEYALQARERTYATPGLIEVMERMLAAHAGPLDEVIESRRNWPSPDPAAYPTIAKGVFVSDDSSMFERIRDELGDDFEVITGTIPLFGTGSGEVSLPSVNKGSALADVADHMGIPLERVIALGDNNNDLEMLRRAGTGIAMGVSTSAAQAAADELTDSVAEHGLAKAFLRHGLIERVSA